MTDSIPVMRASPTLVAMPFMPMMMGTQMRSVSFDDNLSRSASTERTCETSRNRLDDLDARVDALNLRMQTILKAVETQTRILEEIKAEGSIGKKKIPSGE